eukprot:4404461-Lingulodinium_polyedra.AAC.1
MTRNPQSSRGPRRRASALAQGGRGGASTDSGKDCWSSAARRVCVQGAGASQARWRRSSTAVRANAGSCIKRSRCSTSQSPHWALAMLNGPLRRLASASCA